MSHPAAPDRHPGDPIDLAHIARLEETRIARSLAEIAPESRPWCSGIMCRAAPGSWINCAFAAGLDGPAPDGAIDELLDFYVPKGIEPRIELAPAADATLLAQCERAGMVVRVFENVFYRELGAPACFEPPAPPPPGLTIEVVDPADARAVREYVLLAMSGFYPPGLSPTEEDIEIVERGVRLPRSISVLARVDGVPASAGGMEVARTPHGAVAALYGLSTRPEFRRRGIQQAMIARRLELAAQRGAAIATISSRPGVATERNVRRMGFHVAYTKAVLVKPGEGLARVLT